MSTAQAHPISTPRLQHLWLELTAACNLECHHCYTRSGPHRRLRGAMGLAEWQQLLIEARETDCPSIQFIGGEPTIFPDFPALLAFAHDLDFPQIEVFTNATRITPRLVDALQATGTRVACSFYSDNPAAHDHITARPGSFERTVSGIESLLAHDVSLRVGIVEMKANQGHGPAASDFLQALGVRPERITFDGMRPVGRGLEQTTNRRKATTKTEGLCGQCWKGRLCVTPSGDSYPCIMSRRFPVGNVLQGGLNAVLDGPRLLAARGAIENALPENDSSCTPQDCTPNRYCGPDGLCGPGVVHPESMQSSCIPDDCTPNKYCGPDGLCGPGRINPRTGFGRLMKGV